MDENTNCCAKTISYNYEAECNKQRKEIDYLRNELESLRNQLVEKDKTISDLKLGAFLILKHSHK